MKALLGLGVLAGVLLLGADRGAHALAEDRLRSEAAAEGLEGAEATIEGFPFLTQALDRRLEVVRLTGRAYTAPDGRSEDVRVLARGVDLSSDEVTVAAVTIEALVRFATVEDQLGGELSIEAAPRGEVRISTEAELLGERLRISATGSVQVEGAEILLRPTTLEAEGVEESGDDLADSLRDVAGDFLGPGRELRYPVAVLIEGTRLERATVTPRGFEVTLTGTDVPLRR